MDKQAIIKIYVDLVRAGRRDIDSVPQDIRQDVETQLGTNQDA